MTATLYVHDGSFEGLLSAVAVAVKSARPVSGIADSDRSVPQLFVTPVTVVTDPDQARRLFSYLQQLGGSTVRFAMNGYLSEDQETGLHLYHMVRLCLRYGAGATELYSDDSIRYLSRLSRRVDGEAHRLCGLIRFRLLLENCYYAPFESDCNVIGYLARHFIERMGSRQWILHDLGRELALYWDGGSIEEITIDDDFTDHVRHHGEVPPRHFCGEEQYYQQLWRSFHTVISNPDRKNPKLQRQLMPKRYWRYLVEMRGEPGGNSARPGTIGES